MKKLQRVTEVSHLKPHEFNGFLEALDSEGWYVEKVYLESLYREFSDDFFIAYKDKKVLGYILAQKHNDNFAFISNLVIVKEFRLLGFAKELLSYALEHLKGCQIALECDKSSEFLYAKYGFKSYFESVCYIHEVLATPKFLSRTTQKLDAALLSKYNQELLSEKFAKHINFMAEHQDTKFCAIYSEQAVSSYGLSTEYKDGYKVTMMSQNYEELKDIFFSLINLYEVSTKIYVDVTPLEVPMKTLVEELNMKEYSKKSRMYNKVL